MKTEDLVSILATGVEPIDPKRAARRHMLAIERQSVIETRSLTVVGAPRTYVVYRPAAEGAGTPRPLLVLLHGSQSNGRELLNEWIEVADKAGVTLLAPNATTPVGWRIREDGPDYLRAVINDFATRSGV